MLKSIRDHREIKIFKKGGSEMRMQDRLKALRESKGLTQEQVGAVLGVKKATINKYEQGEIQNIKRSNIKKLADLFGVTPTYLMCLEDDGEQTAQEKALETEVRMLEEIQSRYGKQAIEILELISKLNVQGQKKVIEQIEMISKIPQYQKGER